MGTTYRHPQSPSPDAVAPVNFITSAPRLRHSSAHRNAFSPTCRSLVISVVMKKLYPLRPSQSGVSMIQHWRFYVADYLIARSQQPPDVRPCSSSLPPGPTHVSCPVRHEPRVRAPRVSFSLVVNRYFRSIACRHGFHSAWAFGDLEWNGSTFCLFSFFPLFLLASMNRGWPFRS